VEPIVHSDVFVRLDDLMAAVERAAVAAPVPVAPVRLPSTPRHVKVRPLQSPDNYARRIDQLIRSAEERLYLQYSYISWNDVPSDQAFRDVLLFLGELSRREDFDLRVIMDSRDVKEKARTLAQNGWNEAVVRGQGRVHNKGIIVDGKRVLVSSQNWSGDGFLRNRDAGVIVDDTEIAGYYESIFLDDWNTRARPPLMDDPLAMIARDGERTPSGIVRMS
jgi:phosphatidylserine/phosphatidylglycerophosphate/cardiolipin synthase-like enzyme